MAAVEVSRAVITEEKLVDPSPAATEPQENSAPQEDSAAIVEKLDEISGADGKPDQPLEDKPNGVEETSTKETGETAAEQAVAEQSLAKETAEVKEETPEIAAAEVTEKPKDVIVVKESEPEVEPAAIVEAPPAKEDDPEAKEEACVEKLASVPNGENEKVPEVDGAEAAAAEAAE